MTDDELDRKHRSPELFRLLTHYAERGAADTQAWQDRLMAMEGITPSGLVQLHGQLIAAGWVQQNTGHTPASRLGVVPGCYRVTAAGLRVLRQASGPPDADDEREANASANGFASTAATSQGEEKPRQRRRRRGSSAGVQQDNEADPDGVAAAPAA